MVKSWWNNFSERGVAAPLSFFMLIIVEMLHYFHNVTAFLLMWNNNV